MKKLFYILSAALIGCAAPVEQSANIEVLGHRGGRYEVDENTLSAFVTSYENGVLSYETDIRLTADNELIISHDASLKRTFGVDVNVEQNTRAQLAEYKSLKGNPVLFVDELAEFFGKGNIRYVEWEMKSNNYTPEQLGFYCTKLYNTTMNLKNEGAIYVYSSFDERAILTMKQLFPESECMYLTSQPVSEEIIAKAESLGVRRLGCTIHGTSRDAMKKAHEAGMYVNLWPGSNVEDFQLALALGADIACTDVPTAVLNFVKTNMKWVNPTKDLK
jgi:glycerophosphoryl diester phosphodiesterase